jgi:hypothetical protein
LQAGQQEVTGRIRQDITSIGRNYEAVSNHLNGGNWCIVHEFTEIESGKRSDSPELDDASEVQLPLPSLSERARAPDSRDGHDLPRLVDECVPSVAAVVDDIVEGFENSVRQPVLPHELPDIAKPYGGC